MGEDLTFQTHEVEKKLAESVILTWYTKIVVNENLFSLIIPHLVSFSYFHRVVTSNYYSNAKQNK